MESRSKEVWERQFSEDLKRQRRWPSEELVAFIEHTYPASGSGAKVLELGVGAGNNVWYLVRKGFQVCGIDHSENAIKYSTSRLIHDCGLLLMDLSNIRVGSIEKLNILFPVSEQFDGIIDVRAVQHLNWKAHYAAYESIGRLLKKDGWFFSVHLNSQTHDREFHNGKTVDAYTIDENTDPNSIYPNVGTLCMPSTGRLESTIRECGGLSIRYMEEINRSYFRKSVWSSHSVILAQKLESSSV